MEMDREIFQLINGKKATISKETLKDLARNSKLNYIFKGKAWYGLHELEKCLKDGYIVEIDKDINMVYVYSTK